MIGIFDSGIGGLTVVREVLKQLPQYRIVYFGDTARTPYGPKSPRTISDYALEDTEFLLNQGAQVIVVACNSVSAVATDVLKERFRVPIFEVIAPAVRTTLALTRSRRVGIIGTRATIGSGVYERSLKALEPEIQVFSYPCPLLVPLVEEGWLKRPETIQIVRKYLYPLKLQQIDTLVLGCTHYPLLKGIIQTKIGRRVRVIDSSQEVAAWVKAYLEENPDLAGKLSAAEGEYGGHRFFVSDLTPNSETIARDFLGRAINLEVAEG
jgi:glutamate racemase